MINFKYLRWKNFLSTGNIFTEIKLDKSKSTLIVGENGAGKSTILDALSFALYGKPFRKINKPQLMNTINQKGLEVQVEFTTNNKKYHIIRGIKPNKFEIYENDKLINQDAAARDYQEFLEKNILKLNHKSFSQIVVLGSSTFVPFMQLSSMHRREVIEDLLDIQIFSTMNTLLKEKVNTNKSSILDNDYNINLAEEKIKMQNQYIADVKHNSDKRVNEAKVKIANANKEKEKYSNNNVDLQGEVDVLQEEISDYKTLNKKKDKINQLEYKLQDKIQKLNHDISFYDNHDNCPVCKQDIEDEFKELTINDKKTILDDTIKGFEQLKNERELIDNRISDIINTQAVISSKQTDINNNYSQINALNKIINSINEDIKNITANTDSSTDNTKKLETLQKALLKLQNQKEELLSERSVLDIASMILKDSGIKTRIIKQYIPIMNKLINKYLAAMDFFVDFQLDENFNETIKSRFRDEFSYASFSEGEKMRIDLALLFTWRAVAKLRNSISTNLLIMDEVFDSSLDNTGTEEFLKILNDLTSDTNVFIISHKGDQLFDKFHSVIRFEKHKNFSRIAA